MIDTSWTATPRDRWCVGLPIVATRPLHPEEAAQLRSERARRRVYLGLGLLLLVAPFPMMMGAVIHAARHGGHVSPVGFALGILLLVSVFPGVGGIATLRAAKQLRAIRKEIRASQVLKFEGVVVATKLKRGPVFALVRSGDVTAGKSHVLDVLAASGRLVRVDGRSPRARLFLGISNAVAPPMKAEVAAQWLRPARLANGTEILHGSRSLGLEEEGELATHVDRLGKRSGLGGFLLLLCVVVFCIAARSHWALWVRVAVCVGFGVATILDGAKVVVVVRVFLGLRRDLRAKRIVIVVLPPKEGGSPPPPMEMLMHSRLPWSQMGRPAPWRAGAYVAPQPF